MRSELHNLYLFAYAIVKLSLITGFAPAVLWATLRATRTRFEVRQQTRDPTKSRRQNSPRKRITPRLAEPSEIPSERYEPRDCWTIRRQGMVRAADWLFLN